MIKFNFKNKISKKGFTLLEALVATSILMVAVAAPITIAQKGLSSAVYSKNQMIASYLAQDAIEYIKNKRDTVSINNIDAYGNPDWVSLSGFATCLEGGSCQIDTVKNSDDFRDDIQVFNNPSPKFLKKGVEGGDHYGFYQYMDGVDSSFTREINIDPTDIGGNRDEALVTVTVRWGSDKVVVKTLIYNI